MNKPTTTWLKFLPRFLRSRFADRPELLKVLNNISWLLFGKFFQITTGLFVYVWVARYLGPVQFGQLNFAIAFVGLFAALASMGLHDIVVRELSRYPTDAREILGSSLFLQVCGGLVSFAIIILSIFSTPTNSGLFKLMVSIVGASLVFKSSEVIRYWFESQLEVRFIVWVDTAVLLLVLGTKIILILAQAPLIAFVWVILAEAMLVAIGRFLIYSLKATQVGKWKVRPNRAKALLHDSWPLIFTGLVLMVQARIDQVMLGSITGAAEVGYYTAALQVVETAAFTAIVLRVSFLPTLTKFHKESEMKYRDRLSDFYRLNFLISIATAVPISIFGARIIGILFGEAYQPAGTILSVMSIRIILAHMGTARSIFLLNENMMKYSLLTMAVGTLINVLMNLVLIPRYAGIGAVIATIISFAVTTFIVDAFYRKTRDNLFLMLGSMLTATRLLRATETRR